MVKIDDKNRESLTRRVSRLEVGYWGDDLGGLDPKGTFEKTVSGEQVVVFHSKPTPVRSLRLSAAEAGLTPMVVARPVLYFAAFMILVGSSSAFLVLVGMLFAFLLMRSTFRVGEAVGKTFGLHLNKEDRGAWEVPGHPVVWVAGSLRSNPRAVVAQAVQRGPGNALAALKVLAKGDGTSEAARRKAAEILVMLAEDQQLEMEASRELGAAMSGQSDEAEMDAIAEVLRYGS